MPETNADQLNRALSALNGAIPVALFPVKVQTRFATQSMVDAFGNGSVPAPDPAAAPAPARAHAPAPAPAPELERACC